LAGLVEGDRVLARDDAGHESAVAVSVLVTVAIAVGLEREVRPLDDLARSVQTRDRLDARVEHGDRDTLPGDGVAIAVVLTPDRARPDGLGDSRKRPGVQRRLVLAGEVDGEMV